MCSAVLPPSVQNNSAKSGWIFERAESENELRAERSRCHARIASNLSDPLILPRHVSSNSLSIPTLSLIADGDSPEDMCKSNAVQIKGRFSVSSENIDVIKDSPRTRSASFNDFLSIPTQVVKAETTERERILLVKILELQARIISLTNELSAERLKHTQLQQQLSIAYSKRNGEKLDF